MAVEMILAGHRKPHAENLPVIRPIDKSSILKASGID
jgi:hypothetical protein